MQPSEWLATDELVDCLDAEGKRANGKRTLGVLPARCRMGVEIPRVGVLLLASTWNGAPSRHARSR